VAPPVAGGAAGELGAGDVGLTGVVSDVGVPPPAGELEAEGVETVPVSALLLGVPLDRLVALVLALTDDDMNALL
jgi:hypothetical protein